MSRAQKLVNRALAILQRQSPPDSLNDQKALAELKSLFDGSEPDDGVGTASDMVRRTKETLKKHSAISLNDRQAVKEISGILVRPAA